MELFEHDSFRIEQLIRPMVNLYQVSAVVDGAPRPVAFVRQKRMAIKEDIRFFADEGETRELFRLKARSVFEIAGRYDVDSDTGERLGTLEKVFGASLLRSTWRILDPEAAELATAYEKSMPIAILRRVIDYVPYVGGFIPIPYHFTIASGEQPLGELTREYSIRDRYVLDLSGDPERRIDRRLAIALAVGLDALQNR